MMRRVIVWTWLLALAVSPVAHAASVFSCEPKTNFYYINGVSVAAEQGSGLAAAHLTNVLKTRGVLATGNSIVPLRNPSNGLVLDVMIELANEVSHR